MSKRAGSENNWTNAIGILPLTKLSKTSAFLSAVYLIKSRILEYGCSSGFMLCPLIEQGCEVHGVEPSGLFSKYSASNGIRIHNVNENLCDNYNQYFDLILHFFVFEHILDPFAFLDNQFSLLRPGGSICLKYRLLVMLFINLRYPRI